MKDYARFSRTGHHLMDHKEDKRKRDQYQTKKKRTPRHHHQKHHRKHDHHNNSLQKPTKQRRQQQISKYQYELRKLGEPILLFGENNVAIRKRLSLALALHKPQEEEKKPKKNEIETHEEQSLQQLTPHQKKLQALRLKLNAIRQKDMEDLVKPQQRKKKKFQTRTLQKHQKKKHMNSLDVTMAESQEREFKEAEKQANRPYTGWEVHSVNNAFRNYNKHLDNLPYTREELEKASLTTQNLEKDASTRYGATDVESKNNRRRMALEEKERYRKRQEGKEANVSRFVNHPEVNYINSKNMYYNRTLEKYYGAYTNDLKLSLERGTSIQK